TLEPRVGYLCPAVGRNRPWIEDPRADLHHVPELRRRVGELGAVVRPQGAKPDVAASTAEHELVGAWEAHAVAVPELVVHDDVTARDHAEVAPRAHAAPLARHIQVNGARVHPGEVGPVPRGLDVGDLNADLRSRRELEIAFGVPSKV